jgi:hypothetical protein
MHLINLMHHREKKKPLNERKTWIYKPSLGSQGDGIFLSQDLKKGVEQCNLSKHDYVIQEYIPNPLLIDGFKFDLRLYVLVTSLEPLTVYLYEDGLVRLCTMPYVPPEKNNLNKAFMHLTNYSLNKYNDKFEHNTSADDTSTGNKRNVLWLNEYLRERNMDVDTMWADIKELIIKTLIAMRGSLMVNYHAALNSTQKTSSAKPSGRQSISSSEKKPTHRDDHCFHILGFDVLLDDQLAPYLIEVNNHPSLQCDAPIDEMVKKGLIIDTWKIIGYDTLFKKKQNKREEYEYERAQWEKENATGMRKIEINWNKYEHLAFLSSRELIDMFLSSCGVRSKTDLGATRFLKTLRQKEIAANVVKGDNEEPVIATASVDLLFIEMTRKIGASALDFPAFLDTLVVLAKRLYGETEGTDVKKSSDSDSDSDSDDKVYEENFESELQHLKTLLERLLR